MSAIFNLPPITLRLFEIPSKEQTIEFLGKGIKPTSRGIKLDKSKDVQDILRNIVYNLSSSYKTFHYNSVISLSEFNPDHANGAYLAITEDPNDVERKFLHIIKNKYHFEFFQQHLQFKPHYKAYFIEISSKIAELFVR